MLPPSPNPPNRPAKPPKLKAGVNVSVVYGSMPPEAYRAASGNPELMKAAKDAGDTRWGPVPLGGRGPGLLGLRAGS